MTEIMYNNCGHFCVNLRRIKMRVTITGKTKMVLCLSTLDIQIHGLVSARNIEVNTEAEEKELAELKRMGLIEVINEDEVIKVAKNPEVIASIVETDTDIEDRSSEPVVKNIEKKHKKIERKQSKRVFKSEDKSDQERMAAAEAITQKEGSRVIIAIGDNIIQTKMVKNAAGEVPESKATKASLEAMIKLEDEEENEDIDDRPPVKEEDLAPEEQMGRVAVVMDEGSDKKIDLVPSILPGSLEERDPFIDKDEDAELKEKPIVIAKEKPLTVKNEDKDDDSEFDPEDIFAPDFPVQEDEDGGDFIEC